MKTIYDVTVTEIGSQVEDFMKEKMLILFNDNAPAELRDICVLHTEGELSDDIRAGDLLLIDDEEFRILFVGEKVNQTMKDLGHATFTFNGSYSSELPGTVCVEDKQIPRISRNTRIRFIRK